MRTPNNAESYLRYPTSTLLATPGSVRVLRELLAEERPLSVRSLSEGTRLSAQAVRNTLATLVAGGLVEELGRGRGRLYRVQVSHPLYLPLGALFQAEAERFDTILEGLATALSHLRPAPLGAWIYGAVARGEDLPDSSVEVAVVAADEEVEPPVTRLRQMVLPIQEVQRVWISLVGLAPSDVRRLAPDDRWWVSATEPYLPVFGKTPDELVHALQRPSTPRGLFRG
jgi:DNA-binding transcriptional ArsR family regulator